jgi:hypothetical protein
MIHAVTEQWQALLTEAGSIHATFTGSPTSAVRSPLLENYRSSVYIRSIALTGTALVPERLARELEADDGLPMRPMLQ